MQPKKKSKFVLIFYLFIMLAIGYFSMLASLAAGKGKVFATWYEDFNTRILPVFKQSGYGITAPLWFRPYLNEYTGKFIVYGLLIASLIILMFWLDRRNYIAGKEFGTARYANPRALTKILASPDNEENLHTELLKGKKKMLNTKNRQLSQNLWMSIDTRHTDLNNNIFIIGGPGSGKSFRLAIPLLFSMTGSFVVTDCKSELRRKTGSFLEKHGYVVKSLSVINTEGMKKSAKFNPFCYLRTETDVLKLCTSIITNTKEKESTAAADPFWENAEKLLMQALIFYILEEEPPEKQNFRRYMELLAMAEFETDPKTGSKKESELDRLFAALEAKEKRRIQIAKRQGDGDAPGMSLAVLNYNKTMRGAADTVRSIIISHNARLANLQTAEILNLLEEDELNLAEIGMGHNRDGKTKTALFLEIPDNDTSYNFIIGMLYTLLFQELYYQADNVCPDGALPIHVTNLWDEFANVALPEDVLSLMSTMRGRNISAIPILQNMAQIKGLFKDTYEQVPGNCDTLIYLGGNEQSTHEYISKLMGKGTYDKKTTGDTRGRQGSSSRNYDVVGRELMLPDEVRKMRRNQSLVIIAGHDPVIDQKIQTNKTWQFYYYNNPVYEFDRKECRHLNTKGRIAFAASGCAKNMQQGLFTINADALLQISSEQINAYGEENFISRLEEDILVSNAERIREEEITEKEKITDADMKHYNAEEIQAVLILQNKGYSDSRIRLMLPLMQIYKPEELQEMFRPDTELSHMKMIIEKLKNERKLKEEQQEYETD